MDRRDAEGNRGNFGQHEKIVLQSTFLPPARPEPDPDLFNNYELSWLKFNWRVLQQAIDDRNPLMERIKFIAITASNLDEFFQKRVGGLKRQLSAGIENLSLDGRTPDEQLIEIHAEVTRMIAALRGTFFDEIVPELGRNGVFFRQYAELDEAQRKTVDRYFDTQLYPILTPLVVDQTHPFPLISNKSRSFAVELHDPVTGENMFARVKIPANRPRWITASKSPGHLELILIDDLMRAKIGRLFPGAMIVSANVFRVTRNADIARNEEEAEDLLEMIEEELRERRFAEVVRLEIDRDTPWEIRKVLMDRMEVKKIDVFDIHGPIGLADTMELYKIKFLKHLRFRQWIPVTHPVLRTSDDTNADLFAAIRKGDFLVHHPYHSFASSVQRFIEQAAADPDVLAIKQTLYRTSKDSGVMHALMRAAEDGKQVTVLVELKARFDEERNIEWAQKLEKAGVHVAYGIAGLKIHSKITVVVRQERDELRRYVHIGTGNYHPDTAQLYEDLGLFTCEEDIASDVTDLFNFLTGFAPAQQYRKLLVAPHFMRNHITERIYRETEAARRGEPARILMKMNNLEDPLIIKALYEASQNGVRVDCIARSVCRLRPGLARLSEHIHVHSILGRFLEHSRLYFFHAGGKEEYFIGSADMMHRNLDARVEALVPIEDPSLKHYLSHTLERYLSDNRLRWDILPDGSHRQARASDGESVLSIQETLMQHHYNTEVPIPMAASFSR
jgi:polyphosphate kinase